VTINRFATVLAALLVSTYYFIAANLLHFLLNLLLPEQVELPYSWRILMLMTVIIAAASNPPFRKDKPTPEDTNGNTP